MFHRQLLHLPRKLSQILQVLCIVRQQTAFGGRIVNLSVEQPAPEALGAEMAEILHETGHTNGMLPLEHLTILATKNSKVFPPVPRPQGLFECLHVLTTVLTPRPCAWWYNRNLIAFFSPEPPGSRNWREPVYRLPLIFSALHVSYVSISRFNR